MFSRLRLIPLLCAVIAVLLAAPAGAGAAQRYAAPGLTIGDPNVCAQNVPCSIEDALAPAYTNDGDEVILGPGTYTPSTSLGITDAIDVHGTGHPDITRIESSQTFGVAINNAGATLHNVTVDHSVSDNGALFLANGVVKNSKLISSGAVTCVTRNGLLRNSFCLNTKIGGAGLWINQGGAGTSTVNLRNVTAIASGSGGSVGVMIYVDTAHIATINGIGVIASGALYDVAANDGAGGSSATIQLANSNYEQTFEGTFSSVTPAGTNGNQTAAPQFVNAAAGDYHQAAGSPTIDAGAVDGSSGTTDFDGDARTLGSAPDIGADEFVPPAPPAVPDTTAPDTKIVKKPKRKTRRRLAAFTFSATESGATFRCKLDRARYKSCRSPFRKRVRPGRHVLRVVAVDAAGNVDPKPAVWRWRVTN